MASIKLKGDTSGELTISAPAVAGTNTLTLPASTGTLATIANVDASKITEADQWRLTAITNTGTNDIVSTNWEQVDNAASGFIGTGLTESSGTFSFPSTGIYNISYTGAMSIATLDSGAALVLKITTDNSTYNAVARATGGNTGGSQALGSASSNFIFDVTDITTHKIQFHTLTFSAGTYLAGNTGFSHTGFTVIRLGDT